MAYNRSFISVIIAAAGMGKRMGAEINKQYLVLRDKPILAHTIKKFEDNQYIDEIIVVTRDEEKEYCKTEIINKYSFKKVTHLLAGGEERQDSVYNGLKLVNKQCKIVLIHDGVRPFIKDEEITECIETVIRYEACVIGVPVKDTIKVIDNDNNIINTPIRDTLWAVHTPQAFTYELINRAYENAKKHSYTATDDSMLVEKLGHKVKMIKGSFENIKITTPEDLKVAELLISTEKR